MEGAVSLPRRSVLVAMFCTGAFAVGAQVTFLREMLVAVFGNELAISTILACWLIGIGAGAALSRVLSRASLAGAAPGVLLAAAGAMLPLQVYLIRTLGTRLGLPPGEYLPFHVVLLASLLICLPACLCVGAVFPLLCARALPVTGEAIARNNRERSRPINRLYAADALGSMAGGIVLTYLLLPYVSSFRVVALTCGAGFLAAATSFSGGPRWRVLLASAIAGAMVVIALTAGALDSVRSLERRYTESRWTSLGVLGAGRSETRLLATLDTKYQNLALVESEGQYALYANGKVAFVFPDPIVGEHEVHSMMAQNPHARAVLMLGGDPIDAIPEILKYPVERLVYIDLDPGVGQLLASVMPDEMRRLHHDRRVVMITDDGPRFVRTCREQFDLVMINAPEPVTAAANRFYTVEFYRKVRDLLKENGTVCTAVTSSERLQSEAVDVGASVYQALRSAFPVVLVTAEARNRFLAGPRGAVPGVEVSGPTLDRSILYERSRSAGLKTRYFHPESLLTADEMAPDKVEAVVERFAEAAVLPNTELRPVTYFYNLMVWSRFSGSSIGAWLGRLRQVKLVDVVVPTILAGLAGLAMGLVIRCRRGSSDTVPVGVRGWTRALILLVVASTGFVGMSMELLLVYLFQSVYGFVYSRIGMVVAMFMLGLAAGALAGQRPAAERGVRALAWLAVLDLLLLAFACLLPGWGGLAVGSVWLQGHVWIAEAVTYLSVAAVGLCAGAEFALANRILIDARAGGAAAASMTAAADQSGAAAGSLIVGCLLVPVLGIGNAALVLGAVKAASLLWLASLIVAGCGRRSPAA